MDAKVHKRAPVKRAVRTAKTGSAREAIGALTPGCEIYVLTFGQFSLIDAICALVEQTGPADVTLSTWTAANADLTVAARLLESAQIRSMRFIVDRSFLTRQPAYCESMRRLFGDEAIRTTRSHAKFVTIRNDSWTLAVRTSMNLNTNPRLENIEISDDPALCGFLNDVADALYEEQDAGELAGELPLLAEIPNVGLPGRASAGKMSATGLRTPIIGPPVRIA